jgi:hypothetical protein
MPGCNTQLAPSRTRRPGLSLAGWTMIEVFDTAAARYALARRKLRCPDRGQALNVNWAGSAGPGNRPRSSRSPQEQCRDS